jgi:hypothetical protein
MSHVTAAGVLPKSTYHGSDYYYFGVEKKKNEITTFCGKKNKGETNRKAAAREFTEESLGAITSKKTISGVLKNKNITRIENSHAKQITYIARVSIKGNPITKFQAKLKNPKLKPHQKEIKRIIAIEASHLRKMVANNQQVYQGSLFRGDAWGTLKLALNSGKL